MFGPSFNEICNILEKNQDRLTVVLDLYFKGRLQNKNRTTSAASRYFTINALNKLMCQYGGNILS